MVFIKLLIHLCTIQTYSQPAYASKNFLIFKMKAKSLSTNCVIIFVITIEPSNLRELERQNIYAYKCEQNI